MKDKYRAVIGLEIHVELATKSKMFCACPAKHFGIKPNTRTCPVCLGLPGALPVPNEKAIFSTMMIGHALGCTMNRQSKFDRKHYFYPDLPKGYQISQYDEPLAINGFLKILKKKVRIRRVHIEEDTGKLLHKKIKGKNVTLVDYNRSGVPLVEIVTEPDITSATEAKNIAQEIQKIVRWLAVSDCDMEKGRMRLEPNISLSQKKQKFQIPNYKVELKNINSFRFLEKAIDYEIERQSLVLEEGGKMVQETRGWDEQKNITTTQRFKETEADYRYFPEPDIPPMNFEESYIKRIKKTLPRLPKAYRDELKNKYNLPDQYIKVLTLDKEIAEFTLKALAYAVKEKISFKDVANRLVNQKVKVNLKDPKVLVNNIKEKSAGKITKKGEIVKLVEQVIAGNKEVVVDYKKGKTASIQVLIGKVMKISKGSADPVMTKQILEEKLRS